MILKNIILVEDSISNLSHGSVYFEDIAHIFSSNHCYYTTLLLTFSDEKAHPSSNFEGNYVSSYRFYLYTMISWAIL